MGLGTMQWGDIKLPDRAGIEFDKDIHQVFQSSLDAGINFFDTAEIYGNGRSETYLGKYLPSLSNKVVVATKFMPFPWRLSKGELKTALVNSLERLGLTSVDLYQMHWPFPPVPIRSWMDAMADVVAEGLIRNVGVSNYSPSQTRLAFDTLIKHNIPLASNQVKYNLLDRRPENSGLVDLCKQLEVTIIAYSPLEKGILTGKYTSANLQKGLMAWKYNKTVLTRIEPLLVELREIGQAHGGMTSAKVALNWLICKGAVPIPGARNLKQAQENAGSLGWRLSNEEVTRLDKISTDVLDNS
jgi:aryl-alcohol dehydrogenase-like predicted oxidoreductase